MVEPTSAPPPGEPLDYRPLSGLALTGFALCCLFTVLVVVSTLVALAQGLPVFLPGWTLSLAAASCILCLLARIRIRNSEGTLAGLALARWGLWLSLLLGTAYFVYSFVTGLALAKQADDFLMVNSGDDSGFFPRLANGRKNRIDYLQAFLLSLPVTSRGGSKAANEEAMLTQYNQPGKDGEGNIDRFAKHPLVQALTKGPQIEPLSIVDWGYDKNAYHVTRNYRFSTPERVIETAVTVQSTEGASAGEQRVWFVDLSKVARFSPVFTPLGDKLMALRYYSKVFLEKWRSDFVKERNGSLQYQESDTDWSRIFPKRQVQRDRVKSLLAEIFRGKHDVSISLYFQADDAYADWADVDGRIQIVHNMKMMLPGGDGSPATSVELEFTVLTKDVVDLAEPLPTRIAWEIRKIRVVRATVAAKGGAG